MWRGRESKTIEVQSIDQYRAEVDDLTAAILDGSPPRVDLAFSRGTVATIVDLNGAARSTALAAAT
jgi:ABC-type hemin transport system ATPase subunit